MSTDSNANAKPVVLLFKDLSMPHIELWNDMADRCNVEIKLVENIDRSGLLKTMTENNVKVIVNSPHLPHSFGGWTDDTIHEIPSTVKAVCHFGAGYDSVGNLNVHKEKGIQVSNTPTGVIQATADTAVYLILGTLRNFGQLAASAKEGNWLKDIPLAQEYDGKTLGILGLGGIGAVIRDKCQAAFDFAHIQYHNRRRAAPDVEKDTKYVGFDELLATSDVLVVAVPLSKNTYHLIDEKALKKMKKGSILVNIARGPIVDEAALADALESGHLSSAGLDVFEEEPKINAKLLKIKNTLLLPHAGTHTAVSRLKMEKELLANVESVLTSGSVITLVPELR